MATELDKITGLPKTAFTADDGNLYWTVERMSEGGSLHTHTRHLARTLEEAREKRWDYVHPRLGVIWEGYKLASDRAPQDIMKDASVGGRVPTGMPAPPADAYTE